MTSEKQTSASKNTNEKKLLWELFFNLCLPTLLLVKGHVWLPLSAKVSLAIAIACPLSYGLLEWIREDHFNWIAFLGLVSITVKGSVGLFEGSNQWLAINEMLLPFTIGCVLVFFRLLKKPPFLIKLFLNEQFCNVDTIHEALKQNHATCRLRKHILGYEWALAGLFFISALLNYILVRYLVVHPAGSIEFNHELGLLTWWSFIIIALPATLGLFIIAWRFFIQVKRFTKLSWDEILKN